METILTKSKNITSSRSNPQISSKTSVLEKTPNVIGKTPVSSSSTISLTSEDKPLAFEGATLIKPKINNSFETWTSILFYLAFILLLIQLIINIINSYDINSVLNPSSNTLYYINWGMFGAITLLFMISIILFAQIYKEDLLGMIAYIIVGIFGIFISFITTILSSNQTNDVSKVKLVRSSLPLPSTLQQPLRSPVQQPLTSLQQPILQTNSSNLFLVTRSLNGQNQVTPMELEKIFGPVSIKDITHAGNTTLLLDKSGKIYFLSKDAVNGNMHHGDVPQNFNFSKIRRDNNNITYGLANQTLYSTNDLSTWSILYSNVDDFDIPYDKSIIYIKPFNQNSIVYDLKERKMQSLPNVTEKRIYGRNQLEYAKVTPSGIQLSLNNTFYPNAMKGVFDNQGTFHALLPNSSLNGRNVSDIFGTDDAIIYELF